MFDSSVRCRQNNRGARRAAALPGRGRMISAFSTPRVEHQISCIAPEKRARIHRKVAACARAPAVATAAFLSSRTGANDVARRMGTYVVVVPHTAQSQGLHIRDTNIDLRIIGFVPHRSTSSAHRLRLVSTRRHPHCDTQRRSPAV